MTMKPTYPHAHTRRPAGFTLIEILVVIGIIGLLAALITNLAGPANDKKNRALVEAEKHNLMMVIDAYHEKMGFYPPDNATNSQLDLSTPDGITTYDKFTAQNPLYYELTGVIYDPNTKLFTGDTVTNSQDDAQQYFKRGGFANSTELNKFLLPPPTDKQRHSYGPSGIGGNPVYGLIVPVPLGMNTSNYWHYDCSSTNRHNLDSYDLWAVFTTAKTTVTNGNWSQQ